MGNRTGRLAIDQFSNPEWQTVTYYERPATGPSGEADYATINLLSPITAPDGVAYTTATFWAEGFVSLGAPTAEQLAFVPPSGTTILGYVTDPASSPDQTGYSDNLLNVEAGDRVVFTSSSTDLQIYMEVLDSSGQSIDFAYESGAAPATISFTPSQSDTYTVRVGAAFYGASGVYSFGVTGIDRENFNPIDFPGWFIHLGASDNTDALFVGEKGNSVYLEFVADDDGDIEFPEDGSSPLPFVAPDTYSVAFTPDGLTINADDALLKFWTDQPISAVRNLQYEEYTYARQVGGGANDHLAAPQGSSALLGLGGNDELIGSAAPDWLGGGEGDDVIISGGGRDRVYGDAGNDIITGLADGDSIEGGAGYDVVNYGNLTRSYSVTASQNSATISSDIAHADHISTVEDIRFRDATLTFDPDSNAAFVTRLYDSVHGRAPDPVGLDYWLDSMSAGTTRSEVAANFINSPEFTVTTGSLSTSAYVEYLYTSSLGRGSDSAGMAYWVDQIDAGASRAAVLLSFSESAEHRALTADTVVGGLWITDNNYQQIAALYDAFSDRLPDQGGLNYWVERIESGMSLGQVASSFATSTEFASETAGFSTDDLVNFMYENTLERPSDAGGKSYWTAQVDAGLGKGDLLLNFSSSAEHFQQLEGQLFSGVDFYI